MSCVANSTLFKLDSRGRNRKYSGRDVVTRSRPVLRDGRIGRQYRKDGEEVPSMCFCLSYHAFKYACDISDRGVVIDLGVDLALTA